MAEKRSKSHGLGWWVSRACLPDHHRSRHSGSATEPGVGVAPLPNVATRPQAVFGGTRKHRQKDFQLLPFETYTLQPFALGRQTHTSALIGKKPRAHAHTCSHITLRPYAAGNVHVFSSAAAVRWRVWHKAMFNDASAPTFFPLDVCMSGFNSARLMRSCVSSKRRCDGQDPCTRCLRRKKPW